MTQEEGGVSKKRALPVKTKEVHLEYEGIPLSMTVRTNVKVRDIAALADAERILDTAVALRGVVLKWDFPDEEGNPLPQPADGGLEELPDDLLKMVIEATNTALLEIPNA